MNRLSTGRIVPLHRTGHSCSVSDNAGTFQTSICFRFPVRVQETPNRMETKMLKWSVDLALAIMFAVCFVTGLLKFPLLLQATGIYRLVLPSALISDLHDWSGLFLGFFVLVHLSLNRIWIIAMTKKVLAGNR
jgi:hypothetical protein